MIHYAKKQKKGSLFIIDDSITIDVLMNNKRHNVLKQLFTFGRSSKISVILISQRYKAIPLILRINSTHLIVFDLKNQKEEEGFLEENECFIDDIEAKYNNVVKKQRYNFFYVNKITRKAYNNFQYILK